MRLHKRLHMHKRVKTCVCTNNMLLPYYVERVFGTMWFPLISLYLLLKGDLASTHTSHLIFSQGSLSFFKAPFKGAWISDLFCLFSLIIPERRLCSLPILLLTSLRQGQSFWVPSPQTALNITSEKPPYGPFFFLGGPFPWPFSLLNSSRKASKKGP